MLVCHLITAILILLFVRAVICGKICHHRASHSNCGDNDELIMAHTICRHGDRNPFQPYPNDPYGAVKYWPEGFAQLTNVGKRQHYELGQYFRKRYKSILQNGAYRRNTTYIRSTDIDRTLMSAEANLAGLYEPFGDQIFNDDLLWQPVPVHTQPLVDDYLLGTGKRCDHFDYVMLQYMNTSAYADLFIKYKSLIEYVELKSGAHLPTLTEITNVYDALFVQRLKGKRLPDWAKKVIHGDFEYLNNMWYIIFTATTELKKIRSGYLLKEILDHFTSKILKTLSPNRTLWMYFAHDITIANMLNSLGLFKLHVPPYASCLFFELYRGNGNPYIQIFYRKSLKKKHPSPLNIPGCGTKCPLTKFYGLYEDILPTQSFDKECILRDGETLPPDGNPENNNI